MEGEEGKLEEELAALREAGGNHAADPRH